MEKWAKVRKIGMGKFIFQFGILRFGLVMFICLTIGDLWFNYSLDINRYLINMEVISIFIKFIIWVVGGVSFGYFSWCTQEHDYEEWRREGAS